MSKNLPTIQQTGLTYNAETLKKLKNTVAAGATEAEFSVFIEYCKSTGLNPYKKEIWFIKPERGGPLQMMTGINGFYQIANAHPMYDGTETEIELEGDKLKLARAKVWRKDRRFPSTAEAYLVEYGKNYGNWKSMPRVMLLKCAESMALRKAFPQELNGLYTTEEMPSDYGESKERPSGACIVAEPPEGSEERKVYEEQLKDQQRKSRAAMKNGTAFRYAWPNVDSAEAVELHKTAKDLGCIADKDAGCWCSAERIQAFEKYQFIEVADAE